MLIDIVAEQCRPGLLAVGFERYGSEDALAQNAIMHLFNVYVQVNADARREKELGQPQVTQERARQVFHEMENGRHPVLASPACDRTDCP
jgi:arginyl-tRNA synthetase